LPSRAAASASSSSSATTANKKKGGKAKKRKGGGGGDGVEEDEEDHNDTPARQLVSGSAGGGQVAGWVAAAQSSISGSLLQELLRPGTWALDLSASDVAEERLAELVDRLPWVNPLGLVLPMDWAAFVSLELDGGPRRTSKHGETPWVHRLQRNVPYLLGHYVSVLFLLSLLHGLSHFGLVLVVAGLQSGLILAPPEAFPKTLSPSTRPLLLQVAHLLVWLAFIRSIWQMHLFVKVLVVGLMAGHAYILADPTER